MWNFYIKKYKVIGPKAIIKIGINIRYFVTIVRTLFENKLKTINNHCYTIRDKLFIQFIKVIYYYLNKF